MRLALVVAAAAVLAGCKSFAYQCASSTECTQAGGEVGTCESTGYCSFTDPACQSGRRYGEYAGGYSNECVGATTNPDSGADMQMMIDARMIDAPPNAVTKTFGETGTTDYSGVTADTEIAYQSTVSGNCCNHVSVEVGIEWALFRWNIAAIPAGATVVSAEAEVSTAGDGNLHTSGEVQVYRILEAWDEVACTYFMRTATAAWTNQGGGPPSSRSTTVMYHFAATMDGRFTIPLSAAMVQAWVDNASSDNNGIMIDTNGSTGHLHLAAHEIADPARRALLRVVYVP